MPIASLAHAALSAAAVGILLWILRRSGPRAGGLAAAVPINSLPALFWLSQQHGATFAASAALGALAGTAMTVIVGASFARIVGTRHAATLASSAAPADRTARATHGRDAMLLPMATAALMSLLVSALARHSGPQLCGTVAAVPVVGMVATWAGWRRGGAAAMLQVVRGYLDGMAAKAAFLATLGVGWTLGAGGWGWALGLAAAGLVLRAGRPRRGLPATTTAGFGAARLGLGSVR